MARYDLTDFEWRVIEPLLTMKPRGVPRVDDRRVLNGIFMWRGMSRLTDIQIGVDIGAEFVGN